jgi:hypothetical protein
VPNWKLITMPVTTPTPNDTEKIFIQKKYKSRMRSSRLRSHSASRNTSQLASPMVKAGKRMWNEITKPNCNLDSSSASVIADPSRPSFDYRMRR